MWPDTALTFTVCVYLMIRNVKNSLILALKLQPLGRNVCSSVLPVMQDAGQQKVRSTDTTKLTAFWEISSKQ